MMFTVDLSGVWQAAIPGQSGPMAVPGTLDEAGIGFPDDPEQQWKVDEVRRIGFYHDGDPIVTRLTRKHTFEGEARISRALSWAPPAGLRLFAEVERGRSLRLMVNGEEVPAAEPGCLSAPWRFEITGKVTGEDTFLFLSDNHYPGWPRDAIVYSSAASDETQTNWNGLLGRVRIIGETPVYIADLRALPRDGRLDVVAEIDAATPWRGVLRVACDALESHAEKEIALAPGRQELRFEGLALRPDAERWDLGQGRMQSLTLGGEGIEPKLISFGLRFFEAREGRLCLNGRRVFLRSEANCAVFPETGYPPMEVDAWKDILGRYRAYGVNAMRFHSHCPPEAAFAAADALGMLMQPELSHWDPEHAFSTEESQRYYETELRRILTHLGNHPSFVMLTFGNELHADEAGHRFMDHLLRQAHAWDPTRLYANGSNPHYGRLGADPESDFYTSAVFTRLPDEIPAGDAGLAPAAARFRLRATGAGPSGWLKERGPDWRVDYGDGVAALRETSDQPVFSFEVGQYEVLPDFGEIEDYHGVTSPENLKHIRRKVREKGLEADWPRMVEATGELSLRCYRQEIEAALRTEGFSGISLLGLQDFPGQGTALVGMMNAHLRPKPYPFADPERFAAFFRDTLPMALLPRVTITDGEEIRVPIRIANYGPADLHGPTEWRLEGPGGRESGALPPIDAPAGALTEAGELVLWPTLASGRPEKWTLTVSFAGIENTYPLWVYPEVRPVCPPGVRECRALNADALAALEAGGCVYLAPDSTEEAIPRSLQAQYSTDFWSVCTFPNQPGCMGQLINEHHPIFDAFPTAFFTEEQWAPMAGQRAFLLPEKIEAIVTELDSYAFLRPMAQLFECRCGNGRLMVSSMGLHQLQQHPEARALQQAIYDYMASDRFQPRQRLSVAWIQSLFQ